MRYQSQTTGKWYKLIKKGNLVFWGPEITEIVEDGKNKVIDVQYELVQDQVQETKLLGDTTKCIANAEENITS